LFKKIFGGGSAAISLKFEEQGAFPVGSSHRSLKLETLKPGTYALEVVVDDGHGRTDRRTQGFQVVEE
jgi:uncharacterized protein (DUF2141 family)